MSYNHVVAWIDHAQAHIIHFNRETLDSAVINAHSTHLNIHTKSGAAGSGKAPENASYFDDVAAALKDSREILIVGPAFEKLQLMKHLLKHQHGVADNVVGIETVDHPTDGQLLKFARKYFVKADQLL